MIFPDKSWEQKTNLMYGFIILFGLSLYWISPWIIVSGYFNNGNMVQVPMWLISACIFLFGVGVFLHFSSDMQKHTALKLDPGKLVIDGLFSKSRNMNYFGELMIYLSFALLSMHWIPFAVLLVFIISVWIPNIIKKDRSLSRYQEFKNYKDDSFNFQYQEFQPLVYNPNSFDSDNTFLIWGNDGDNPAQANANTVDVPGTVTERMETIWRVDKTGTIENNSISFDLSGLGYSSSATDFQLIISGSPTM